MRRGGALVSSASTLSKTRQAAIKAAVSWLAAFEDFVEANGFWYTDSPTLWVQYVSKDEDYGLNLAIYPANYEQAVASWLAYQSVLPINKDRGDRADLLKLHGVTLGNSRRLDAVDEAVKQKPAGRWPRVRGFGTNGTSRGLR